jgi:branched-chain amino acid aminotransferase
MRSEDYQQYVIRINRQDIDPAQASVGVFDHGFLFGDSIYEVVRTVKGGPVAWPEHLARLRRSAARLSFELPWSDEVLSEEIETMIRSAKWQGETYIRLILTRGQGDIDLMPTSCKEPNLILIAKALPTYPPELYDRGLKLCITDVRRNSRQSMDPGIKSGNYLNNVLAMIEARSKGADDAVMLNEHGHITECTTSNVFLIENGVVKTASLENGILAGITRGILLAVVREANIPVEETDLTISDIASADEIFMSGSIRGVMPICEVIGMVEWRNPPGPLTKKIKAMYDKRVGLA